tara:strand:- start:67 stop:513 length:447 start_codon:yes stop_codon:yes gene_type:complete
MADLTVTLKEDITVRGHQYGGSKSFTITGINEVSKRVISIPASNDVTIATFAASVHTSVQAFDVEDTRYVRVTNLDATYTVNVACVGASDNFQVLLQPGQSFYLGKTEDCMLGETDTSPAFASLEDLASIIVDSGANAIDVELFVAGV